LDLIVPESVDIGIISFELWSRFQFINIDSCFTNTSSESDYIYDEAISDKEAVDQLEEMLISQGADNYHCRKDGA
jgi:hypothetical protein